MKIRKIKKFQYTLLKLNLIKDQVYKRKIGSETLKKLSRKEKFKKINMMMYLILKLRL